MLMDPILLVLLVVGAVMMVRLNESRHQPGCGYCRGKREHRKGCPWRDE
jgi:hypothetical protein